MGKVSKGSVVSDPVQRANRLTREALDDVRILRDRLQELRVALHGLNSQQVPGAQLVVGLSQPIDVLLDKLQAFAPELVGALVPDFRASRIAEERANIERAQTNIAALRQAASYPGTPSPSKTIENLTENIALSKARIAELERS